MQPASANSDFPVFHGEVPSVVYERMEYILQQNCKNMAVLVEEKIPLGGHENKGDEDGDEAFFPMNNDDDEFENNGLFFGTHHSSVAQRMQQSDQEQAALAEERFASCNETVKNLSKAFERVESSPNKTATLSQKINEAVASWNKDQFERQRGGESEEEEGGEYSMGDRGKEVD